jgi:hypothetical protein
MVISLRSAGGIATIWLAAVVGVSATAWVAIDRAGRDITDVSAKTMPPAPIITPTMGPPMSATSSNPPATPKPSAHPETATPLPPSAPQTTPTPAPPTPHDDSISVTGGLVSVRCTGAAVELQSAQPEFNWRVHVDTPNTGQIDVTFQQGDEESQSRSQVRAVCTNGTAAFTVTSG